MRNIVFSAILALAAAPALATTPITLTSVGIYNPGHVTATTGAVVKDEYSVPLTFTAKVFGRTFDALGFCDDLTHSITVGVGSQLATSLGYHFTRLTTDGAGNALSSSQVRQILGLSSLGFDIAKGSAADKTVQLAAIQQAIWTVEYPRSTFVAGAPYSAGQASYAATFLALAPTLVSRARAIVSDSGNTQAFVTDLGAVPEPAVWAQMIAGFGLVGALARRRVLRTVAV